MKKYSINIRLNNSSNNPSTNVITIKSNLHKFTSILFVLALIMSFGMEQKNEMDDMNEHQFPVYNPSNYANHIDNDQLLYQHFIHAYYNVPDINNAIITSHNKHMQDNIDTIKNAIQNYRDYMNKLNNEIERNKKNKEIQNLYKTEQKFLKTCLTEKGAKITYNLITFLKSKGILGPYLQDPSDYTIKCFLKDNANNEAVKNFIDNIIANENYVNTVFNNSVFIKKTKYNPFIVTSCIIQEPLLALYDLVSEKYPNHQEEAIKVFSTICKDIPTIKHIDDVINEAFIKNIGIHSMYNWNTYFNAADSTQHIIPEDYSPFKYTILPWCIVTFMSGLGGYDNTWINLLTFTKYNIQCNLYIYKSHILLCGAGVNMQLRLPYAIPFLKNILNIHLIGFNIWSFLLGILTTLTFNPNDGNRKYYNDQVGENESSFLFALKTAFLVHGQINKHDFIYLHYTESYKDVAFRISLAATFFINTIQFLSFDFKVLNDYHISINLGTLLMSWLIKYIKSTSGEVYQDINFIKIIDTVLHHYGSINIEEIKLDKDNSSDESKSKSNSVSGFLK